MCRQHLLGEHVEMHMVVGSINKGRSIRGYLDGRLIDPRIIQARHDELADEMERRGHRHKSPLEQPSLASIKPFSPTATYPELDIEDNDRELRARCPECRKLA
jgi:hypothetical protein